MSPNKYSEDIMLLDRFLDKCFARNTFLGNNEDESSRLDVYIDKLAGKDIPSLRNVQKNTIKKIADFILIEFLVRFLNRALYNLKLKKL